MFERIATAYRQMANWAKTSVCARPSVGLQVSPLEERATPAAVQFLPAYPLPEFMVVAPNPVLMAPVPAVATNVPPANCRTDLFSFGDCGKRVQPDVWEEWLAEHETTHEGPPTKQREVAPESAEVTLKNDPDVNTPQAVFVSAGASESGGE